MEENTREEEEMENSLQVEEDNNAAIESEESDADSFSENMLSSDNERSLNEEINENEPNLMPEANQLVSSAAITGRALSSATSGRSQNRQRNLEIGNNGSAKAKDGALFRRAQNGSNLITVSWRNIVYTVNRTQVKLSGLVDAEAGRSVVKKSQRVILKGVSGHFSTGQMTAVMGPSGSGKSTLLECIVGFRQKGVEGDIRVSSENDSKIKAALIAQSDYLIELFTVRETLVYASRLKNYKKDIDIEAEAALEEIVTVSESVDNVNTNETGSKHNLLSQKKVTDYHERMAISVMNQLGLEICADTRAGSCSGGQKKRISIALEMISKPNILILDEPTSGLDSSACYQTVSVMQKLTRNTRYPIAVVTTIHQPSARVFNLFDQIYIISYNGYCIYHGPPQALMDRLTSVSLTCPPFHNPADFIAEIASGEHGAEPVEKLIELKKSDDRTLDAQMGSDRSLSQYSEMNHYPTLLHIWILFQRTTLHTMRDPMLNSLRLLSHALTALFIGLLYGDSIGKPSLCPPVESPLNDLENFPKYRAKFQQDTVTSTENLAYIFFTLMFMMFGAMMPIIMTFPANLTVIRKEKTNGWYSVAAYYSALMFAEIPFQLIYPAIFVAISYVMTGQVMSVNRFLLYLLICIILAIISQSLGLMIGAIFMSDASAAVFLGPIATVPIMLFGGFFVRIPTIPAYLRPFSYLSFLWYAFDSSIIVIYGMGRCELDPAMLTLNQTEKPAWMEYATMMLGEGGEKFIDSFARSVGGTFDPNSGKKYQSSLLGQFDIDENLLTINLLVMVAFLVGLRLITYFILAMKINKRD